MHVPILRTSPHCTVAAPIASSFSLCDIFAEYVSIEFFGTSYLITTWEGLLSGCVQLTQ